MKSKILFIILLTLPTLVYAHDSCNQTESNPTFSNITIDNNACNVNLTLETNNLTFKNGEKIEIYNKLGSKPEDFTIEYWIEDLNKTIIKEKITTNNLNKKQFTPKLKESTYLKVKNNLTYIDCNNTNNNTHNELLISIEVEKEPNPYFQIEKLYLKRSKKIELGSNLTASISVYTGNLTNLTIATYIENITNKTQTIIYNNFNKTIFNTTLVIPNNCSINTSNYYFVTEALRQQLKEEITIINNCKYEPEPNEIEGNITEEIALEENSDESVINLEVSPIAGSLVYESSSKKARKIADYLGIAVLAAIIIAILLTSKDTEETLKETTKEWSSQLEQQLKF